ncbi:MAG: response regulator [Treponema sp.]|nr:response regulator [Treponema sp.]
MFTEKRILVAEDIEINRVILRKMLEGTGLTIDFARNGIDALVMFEDNPQKYNLFITDISMPKLDGYETAKKIRAMDGWGREIPIIAMTANVSTDDVDKCFAAGMNGHLGKPVEKQELLKILQKHMFPDS